MKKITFLLVLLCISFSFAQTVVLEEDFEGGTALPTGWTNNDIAAAGDTWTIDTTGEAALAAAGNDLVYSLGGGTGNYASFDSDANSNNSLAENVALESPTFDCSGLTEVILEYNYLFAGNFGGSGFIEVSSDGGTNWTTITTYSADNYAGGTVNTDVSAQLAGSANAKVRFRWTGNWSVAFYIDNVTVFECTESAPLAAINPTPSIDNMMVPINPDGANLLITPFAWEEDPAGDPAVSYTLSLGTNPAGDNIGIINPATNGNGIIYTWAENTTYYWFVTGTNCGGSTQSPVWSFTTSGCVVTTFPFEEDFEGNGDAIPSCWTQEIETGTVNWTFAVDGDNGGFGTSNNAFSGTRNALFFDTDTADDITKLVTPALDLSSLSSPELSFWHAQEFWSPDQDELRVYYKTSAGGTWTLLASYTNSIPDWTQETLALPNPSNDYYIAFEGNAKYGRGVALDDVKIEDVAPITYTYNGTWSPNDPNGTATAGDDIVITSGNAIINTNTTCNSMTVNPGAGLTVNAGVTLTTTNGLSLESTSTTYSSLILDGSVAGNVNYERYVNSQSNRNDLISVPLSGQTFGDFAAANPNIFSNPSDPSQKLFGPWSKTANQYIIYDTDIPAEANIVLGGGTGYRAASTGSGGTFTFTGSVNTGTVSENIVFTGPFEAEWNLVGNPYPSYINVQDFLNHEVDTGVKNLNLFNPPTAAIYGYDGDVANGGWIIYNLATTSASTLIAPGQGFFVSADPTQVAAYDLEFTTAMRSTGTSDDFFPGRNAELTYITLNLSNNTKAYKTDFYFNTNASLGFDVGYDAAIWGENAPDFSIYSHLVEDNSNNAIALQTLNSSDISNVTIPLGVNANQGEQITFSIADMNIPASVNVYLEDVVANTVTLLNNSDYIITPTTALSGTGRFFLRTSEDALSTIDNTLDNLTIIALNASKELVVSGQLKNNTSLYIYDIQGRNVFSTQLDSTNLKNRINVSNINTGVYIVTVKNNKEQKTQKVIIN